MGIFQQPLEACANCFGSKDRARDTELAHYQFNWATQPAKIKQTVPESLLIEQERAHDLIAEIDHPASRDAVRTLLGEVVKFYNADPSRLEGPFDLAFLAELVKYDISDMAKLLHEVVPRGYWEDPGILPDRPGPLPIDPSAESGPVWLRIGQAYNYCVLHDDKWVGEIIFRLFNFAKLKHEVMIKKTRHYPMRPREPISGATPAALFDLLFMVMAVDHALQPAQPARTLLEEMN